MLLASNDPEEQPLSGFFPLPLANVARSIEIAIEVEFVAVDEANRRRCAQLAVATWALELDKQGKLDVPHRDVALIYQVGRIAAQEVDPGVLPKLKGVTEQLAAGWISSALT